ncbi:MAG TPA: mannose-1-phosphate guanylyltransferase/mannose-6-phosphate isomerase [Geminicoccaceae bacterium]
MLIPVILAGGSGTRLWPLSRAARPKQLVAVVGDETLLQQTARRLLAAAPASRIVVVGAREHDPEVRRQLRALDPALGSHRLLEPAGRNTAAAIALAALYALDRFGSGSVLLVCPSDHLMTRPERFLAAVVRAGSLAASGDLVTFGITPSRPETGYGYIQSGGARADADGALEVIRFVEKPSLRVAEEMLRAGGHFWNSGIFLFRASRILDELRRHAPEILERVQAAYEARTDEPDGALSVPEERWGAIPAQPIDTAVMERADRLSVVPCDPGWSDLGSWQAIWEHTGQDEAGNASRGDVLLENSAGCLVRAEGGRLVALAGVRDLAVIDTPDALLVAGRGESDGVRTLVAALVAAQRMEAQMGRGEDRPWGRFDVLHEGPGFKVKEIRVDPGGKLSLQSHRHRAEHWVVVSGKARVTVDETVLDLEPDQSVHIPLGARHRMENPFDEPMHLIEVQCGSYLGEDDIVRYEDVYGRT